jgi:hypothetical protein
MEWFLATTLGKNRHTTIGETCPRHSAALAGWNETLVLEKKKTKQAWGCADAGQFHPSLSEMRAKNFAYIECRQLLIQSAAAELD